MPVVINVAINEYLVCKPYRKLTSRTPHVENLDIDGVVFPVREPDRSEMHPVIVSRIFILLENKTAARFFKQAVVKCGAMAVVVKLRKQHVCSLASGAVLCIAREVGVNAYLYSIAGFHGVFSAGFAVCGGLAVIRRGYRGFCRHGYRVGHFFKLDIRVRDIHGSGMERTYRF